MNMFKKLALVVCLGVANVASATVIDFNTNADNAYFIGTTTSNGYTIANSAVSDNNIGTMSNFDGQGMTDGSIYLGAWSNTFSQTGITIHNTANALFSMQSFMFDNAYPNGSSRTSTLNIIGTYADNSTTTQTITGLSGVTTFQTYMLNASFENLKSIEFVASGAANVRALYDNFTVNAAAVPEPAPMALLAIGLLGLALSRKKNQA